MPRLLSRDYDGALGAGKTSALFGMAMTEKQGGSDVRANTTIAVPTGDGAYLLTGHKWFCSAPMSDGFLVLAQAPAGLSCFLVARVLDDGERNVFRIQRLKDKLGNRSNASSEVEFDGTVGTLLGEEGRGVRTIIEMVARTRLDCVFGSTAGMRQAVAEAAWHVRHRAAFGRLLVDQPAMTAVRRRPRARVGGGDGDRAAAGAGARRRRAPRRARLPAPGDRGLQVLDLQARARARLRGARVPGRQRLHRGVPARAPLPRAARHGGVGGLRQRDRARRAARSGARARQLRGVRCRVSLAAGIRRLRRSPRRDPALARDGCAAADPDAASRQARRLVADLALALQASLLIRTRPPRSPTRSSHPASGRTGPPLRRAARDIRPRRRFRRARA